MVTRRVGGLAAAFAGVLLCACSGPVTPRESSNKTPAPTPTASSLVPGTTTTPGGDLPVLPGATPTATPTTGACTLQSGNANCDMCGQQSCCTQISACEVNQDCIAMDACVAQCVQQFAANPQSGQLCEQQCAASHPTGAQALNALMQCLGTTCAAQCPLQ